MKLPSKFATLDRELTKLEAWLIDKQLEIAIAQGQPVVPLRWWENLILYSIIALFIVGLILFYMGV